MNKLPRLKKYVASAAVLACAALGLHFNAASLSAGDAIFTLKSDDEGALTQDIVYDHNKCPTEGPTAMYITGNVTNTSGGSISNMTVQMTNLTAGFTYGGGQADTIQLGTMAAGDTQMVGWLIEYPCTDGFTGTADIVIADIDPGTVQSTVDFTVREAKSANAGGNVITSVLGPGAVVGQIIEMDTTYDFGNIGAGNEFFLQPAGSAAFDAGCFQIMGAEVIASNINAIPVGAIDDMHFVASAKQTGNNFNTTVRWYFRYLCAGVSTVARPYSAQTSGNTNLKYTGNFDGPGAVNLTFPGATNPFTITKTASPADFFNGTGGTATFTVTISNPSIYDSYIDKITDILPTGVIYTGVTAASDVTVSNSNTMPANGATETIEFTGNLGSSFAIPGGGSVSLVYTATIPDTVGDYTNTAQGGIAMAVTPIASDTVTVVAGGALTASKTVETYDPALVGVYSVPNEEVAYTISGVNNSSTTIDDGTIVIVDSIPEEVTFYNGDFNDNPGDGITIVNFVDNGSGLTCCSGAHIEFSSTTSGAPVWGYTPSAGFDENVRHIKIIPTGEMNGNDPTTSEFSVQFRARIK